MKCKQIHINKVIVIFFLAPFICACNQNKDPTRTVDKDTVQLFKTNPAPVNINTDSHYYWEALPDDETNRLVMKKLLPLNNDSLTASHIISWINNKYDDVQLQLVKISNDTLFVKIRQSNFLTQQMGSTGADMYLTEATYNLTELNNIAYVHFDFKKGDHASPGTYSRTDFVNIKFSDEP